MVLVMAEDGTLSPSQSQKTFSRIYKDGIGQESAALRSLGETAVSIRALPIIRGPSRPSAPRADIRAGIEETALRYAGHPGLRSAGITVTDWLNLYRANIEVESAYNPAAISQKGAIGLGQLMPGTARALRVDPHDWKENLDGSARYLAGLLAEFGDVRFALAAYNAGPGAVREHGGIPPYRETRNHVQRVLAVFNRLEGATQ
jgi:soluble lytic murein transglycosylase-like protein